MRKFDPIEEANNAIDFVTTGGAVEGPVVSDVAVDYYRSLSPDEQDAWREAYLGQLANRGAPVQFLNAVGNRP